MLNNPSVIGSMKVYENGNCSANIQNNRSRETTSAEKESINEELLTTN